MNNISRNPIYNLKAVLKETGLTADVLRAWERRYGLPSPGRAPGGHRIYSQYDIEILKWLQARREDGLSIGRAVSLWKEHTDSGHDPVLESPAQIPVARREPQQASQTNIDLLRKRWMDACLAFDEYRAEDVLREAFAFYSVEVVCISILQAALADIGEKWYQGEATVQQEHFASALAMQRINTLIASLPYPGKRQTVLLGCPPNEYHSIPILLLNLFLRRNGLRVIYLGANVTLDQFTETAGTLQPELIVLASQHLASAASLQTVASELQKHNFPVAYGGLVFNRIPGLRDRIPAYFLGENLADAVEPIQRLVEVHQPYPKKVPLNESYVEVAETYRKIIPLIDAAFIEILKAAPVTFNASLERVNVYFTNELLAALELGDLNLLKTEIQWVKGLLGGQGVSEDQLYMYLAAYNQAVTSALGAAGSPITGWLESYLARLKNNTV